MRLKGVDTMEISGFPLDWEHIRIVRRAAEAQSARTPTDESSSSTEIPGTESGVSGKDGTQGTAPADESAENPESQDPGNEDLSEEEEREVDELKERDAEVRAHEQAHLAAAGSYALGGASYEFQVGPDDRQYAVGGEVRLDVSAVPGDPDATVSKMETIKRAALAPSQPSSQDFRVAARAQREIEKARDGGNGDQTGLNINVVA